MPSLTRLFGPVRVRITFVAAAVFAITSTAGAIAIVSTVRHSLETRARLDGVGALDNVARQLESGTDPAHVTVVSPTAVPYVVYDVNGKVVAGIPDQQFAIGTLPPGYAPDTGSTAAGTGAPSIRGTVERTNGDVFITSKRITTSSGTFTVAVASPLETVRRSVDALSRVLWFAIPSLVAGVTLLVWFLVGRALRPVEAIRSEVEDISHTTMHRRVPAPASTDEVARLAHTMNRMLDRLEAAATRQRRFVSDASHELRSPVTAMRTDLEVGLRAPATTDWEATARRALGEADRLGRLVDDLLELARLDEGATRPYADVDVDELVALDVASRNGSVPVTTDDVSAGRVRGDQRQLSQLLRNLVDNAVRHARAQVSIGVRTDGDDVVLTVDDDGDGIPESDRARVFERFARLDEARARDAGGAGLGLALVQRVATAHHGTVEVGTSALGGARFAVRLPASN